MKTLFINNDGSGFADYLEVEPNTTVDKLFTQQMAGRRAEDYLIRVNGSVPAGRVLVDGYGVGDVGNIVLRDRKHLSQDGLIVVVATVDTEDLNIISGPDIVSRGFVYVRESEDLMEQIKVIARRRAGGLPGEQHHRLVAAEGQGQGRPVQIPLRQNPPQADDPAGGHERINLRKCTKTAARARTERGRRLRLENL